MQKERGLGRGAARRERIYTQRVQLSATQSSFYMVIYMQLSATHELQSATQRPLKGCLSCAELRLSCGSILGAFWTDLKEDAAAEAGSSSRQQQI